MFTRTRLLTPIARQLQKKIRRSPHLQPAMSTTSTGSAADKTTSPALLLLAACVATATLLTSTAILAECDAFSSPSTDSSRPPKNPKDLHALKQQLLPLLQKVRQHRSYAPPVSIELIPPSDDSTNSKPTYMLHFHIHHQVDSLLLLSTLVSSFPNDQLSFSPEPTQASEISLVFKQGTASFIINHQQLAFFSDELPSADDLTAFVRAYNIATLPNPGAQAPTSSEQFEAMQDFFKHNFKLEMPDLSDLPNLPDRSKIEQQVKGKMSAMNQQQAMQQLEKLGCTVYSKQVNAALQWESLAGYEKVKEDVEATVLLALQHPETYERIARKTREVYETNRPKAILFEGPPGTGKTTTAKIIASQTGVRMVYVPVESIVSKWYGESGKNLSKIFDACEALEDSIIFLDEVDALATKRGGGNMHEATRRTLSTLLRRIDGFKEKKSTIFVCATNRKEDLDPALLSRFDISVQFGLPNAQTRALIFARYAKHLEQEELLALSGAVVSGSMAGRDIKEVCQAAERKWASMLILGKTKEYVVSDAVPCQIYQECSMDRKRSMTGGRRDGGGGGGSGGEEGENKDEYSI